MRKKLRTSNNEAIRLSSSESDRESWNCDDGNWRVFDKEKAYRAIGMLVCAEKVPPKSFVDSNFKSFLAVVNPLFHISFPNIERHCLGIYEEEKAKIKQVLGSLEGQITLSLDAMRHDGRNVYDYICLTARFIDGNWKHKNWVINFSRVWYSLDEPPEIAILKSLSDMDILSKIASLTVVNHEGYDESAEIIKNKVQENKSLQLNGQIFRVHCCADTFRLMVEDAFEEIHSFIWKLRCLVVCWKSPPLWHITLDKLQEAIELESKGQYTVENGCFPLDIPPAKEWKKVRSVCKLVGSIYNAAEVLFHTKCPTAGIYLHNIWELRVSLRKESTSSDRFLKSMARKMLKKLDEYWKDTFLLLAVATVMDPRYKMKYIDFSSMKYEGSGGDSQVATVLKAVQSLFDDYAARTIETENAWSDLPSDPSSSDSEDEVPRQVERRNNPSFGFNCLDEYNQFIQSYSQPPKSELELYLEEPVLPWSKDFKLLNWWKAASPKYPILSKMARDLLAIPFSLTSSYEAFSSIIKKPDRDLIFLSPELMNALMCTRSWFEHAKHH